MIEYMDFVATLLLLAGAVIAVMVTTLLLEAKLLSQAKKRRLWRRLKRFCFRRHYSLTG